MTVFGVIRGDFRIRVAIERLNHEQSRLRRAQRRQLNQWGRGAVIVDHDMFKQRGRCPAGANLGQFLAQGTNRTLHLFLQMGKNSLVHRFPPLTRVPIGSPETTRLMLPFSIKLKTIIGKLLSMHREMAVESMTLSSRFSTSI